MSSSVAPSFLQESWQDTFNSEQHLQDFLNSNLGTILLRIPGRNKYIFSQLQGNSIEFFTLI